MTRHQAVDSGAASGPVSGPVSGEGGTEVRVRVPATSANLGPGYDSFGLALARYDEVTARRIPSGLRIRVEGVGSGMLPTDGTHLVVRAARAAFDEMGEPPPGLDLTCTNAIPHGSGQGSSAAAIVAGILLARALTPGGDARLPEAAVLDLAARLEGHPDNVAPALLGGFTIAWTEDGDETGAGLGAGGVRADVTAGDGTAGDGAGGDVVPGSPGRAGSPRTRAVRLQPHPDLRAIMLATERACATGTARAALPDRVPHADAGRNAARAALLAHAISHEPALMFPATRDWLHQPYRAAVMPESLALVRRLRARGIPAVLSGAGPTVLVLGIDLPEPATLDGDGFRASPMALSASGATVGRG